MKKKPVHKLYRIWQSILVCMLVLGITSVAYYVDTPLVASSPDDVSAEPVVAAAESEFMLYEGELKTGFISGRTFQNTEVMYMDVEGLPIFEGDIVLDFSWKPAEMGLTVPTGSRSLLWPDGLLPYTIDPNMPNQERIHNAIEHWEEHTRIRFVERTSSNANQYPNYVNFKSSFGCWSYVGLRGGKQDIGLAAGCGLGATIHEIGHALGLWHEQGRSDRDEYVTVHFENIIPQYAHNFNQHISDGEDVGEYDYDSLMHYPRWAFSKNGKDTIVPIRENVEIGQRDGLSEGDIAAIEHLYSFVPPR